MRNPSKQAPARSSAFAVGMIVASVAVLYFMREVLIPLAFALTLTFLLTPAVSFLERLRLPRIAAVVLTVLVSITATAWAGLVIGNQLVEVVNQLPVYRENIHAKIQALSLSQKGPLGRAAASVKEIGEELSSAAPSTPAPVENQKSQRRASVQSPLPVQVIQPPPNGLAYLRDLTTSFLRPAAVTGIVVIFTVFMLIQREDLRNRILRLAGLTQLNAMTQALDDAAKRVSRYLFMQFLVNFGFGLVIGSALYFIGVPNPGLWGVVAGILRIVPYVGTLVAGVLPLFLSLAVFNAWLPPLLVFVVFAGVELVVANFVEPWLYGAHTGISSLALLATTVFWTVLWGPAGLVLSTPLTVCVVVLGRYIPELSFLHTLLADEPVLAAEAQLYQRLLAMDQQDAWAVVELFLKSRPLVELYDAVLIPALNMAEQDRHRGALTTRREEFLFLSVNEMVAEFSDYKPEPLPEGETENTNLPSASARVEPLAQQAFKRRILCLPAYDQADEIVAAMLAQVLEQKGYPTIAFPHERSLHELISLLNVGADDVLCVSALPPYAFAPARILCKQLRASFPRATVVVCIWGFTGDSEKAKARFESSQPQRLVTSIGQAVELIGSLDIPAGARTLSQPAAS
jgi:predicted PurR-regulated permease PerM